jgi:hypothetical protein
MINSQPPSVFIVVLNWNGADDTIACLDSLSSLSYPELFVVVVDNGSSDDSLSRLRSYHATYPMTLIETGHNLGYAGGNNVGSRYALEHAAEFILILNNDVIVATDLLDRFVESAQRHPRAGLFSARILYFDQPDRVWFDGAHWNQSTLKLEWPGQDSLEQSLESTDHPTDYVCGAAMFYRSEVARQIGLLDESFFLVWEEVDWCFRASKAGWGNIVVPGARIWHKIGVSFGSESSPLRVYFSIRNELLWFSRHATYTARARLALKSLKRLIPRFILDHGPSPFAKRLLWAVQDYVRACLGHGNRLEYLATRQAIMDFVYGRFGDCPKVVHTWSDAWRSKST